MEAASSYWNDRALLEWQVELGVTDAICDAPVDRYALETQRPKVVAAAIPPPPIAEPAAVDAVALVQAAAEQAQDLPSLAAAMEAFELCDLKKGAHKFVFSDGNPAARVMIVGEAPGREEDRAGKPFVGQAGQLLDKMLAAIGLNRATEDPAQSIYITNVLPWRPPSNRTPDADEIAMMLPFLNRHVALVDPKILILMGNTPCQALLGRAGITRIRGQWMDVLDRSAMPMFHPAYLLRQTAAKRDAWADLLAVQAKLKTLT
ncbi:uracil-DNA glycosylase [Cognatiyoonia koreensis]|nr:uracil-DNA glycosylase [Cognatiyoonia koreensis]